MKESYSFVTTRLIRLFEGNCVLLSWLENGLMALVCT